MAAGNLRRARHHRGRGRCAPIVVAEPARGLRVARASDRLSAAATVALQFTYLPGFRRRRIGYATRDRRYVLPTAGALSARTRLAGMGLGAVDGADARRRNRP